MEQTQPAVLEKAIVAGLNCSLFTKEENATEQSLLELQALLETAGGECVGSFLQSRSAPDPHSLLGPGKTEEIRLAAQAWGASMLIVDNPLSPSQLRALEEMTGLTVLDRSALILDIFAQRARSREGRLQVELAQYQYLLPRLSGMGTSLSRQGGGIGTRGPGETRLETDRRYIRERIDRLKRQLEEVRRVRDVQRRRRVKNELPLVCLVGYTNAGKSSLLNALTDAGIPANNRLFDTLDTTSRLLQLSDSAQAVLSDTVGFIAKLPHNLIDAFQATLEELGYADVLIHVIDASDPERTEHMEVVEQLISQLARPGTPVLECYNKCDVAADELLTRRENTLAVSARTGQGLDRLLQAVEQALSRGLTAAEFLLPYPMASALDTLHTSAKVDDVQYEADGIHVRARVDEALLGRLRPYLRQTQEEPRT